MLKYWILAVVLGLALLCRSLQENADIWKNQGVPEGTGLEKICVGGEPFLQS